MILKLYVYWAFILLQNNFKVQNIRNNNIKLRKMIKNDIPTYMICFNSFNLKGIIMRKNLIELINDNIIREHIGSTIILYFYLSACIGVKLSRFSVSYFAVFRYRYSANQRVQNQLYGARFVNGL